MFQLVRTNAAHPHFVELVAQLDAFLSIKDGDEHEFYDQFNGIENIPYALVAYIGETPVACGAIKPFNETSVEVKRMFSQPSHRGKGLGKAILNGLTQWATDLGYTKMILETGRHFEEAVGLYAHYGFEVIPNYGQYQGVATSVCFQKEIV